MNDIYLKISYDFRSRHRDVEVLWRIDGDLTKCRCIKTTAPGSYVHNDNDNHPDFDRVFCLDTEDDKFTMIKYEVLTEGEAMLELL